MAEQKSSQPAVGKLQGELEKSKNKAFADPIIKHLIKRCNEDTGFADDVLNKKKSFADCEKYIYDLARKKAAGSNKIAISSEQVFEWAEDYYRMENPTVPKEIKASKSKSAKTTEKKQDKKNSDKSTDSVGENGKISGTEAKPVPDEAPVKKPEKKEEPKQKEKKAEPKKKQSDISGQMSLFDLM